MDTLWRVRARYEPERNKGAAERVSVFLVLDRDLAVRKNMVRDPFAEWKRWEERMQISLVEIRFRMPSACRDRDVTVKNAFRNRSSIFSLRLQRGISRAIRKFFSSSSCSLRRKDGIFGCALRVYRIDRRGNLRNSIETDANAIRAWLMLHRIVSKQGSSRDRSDRYPAPTFDRKVARIF